MNRPFLQSAAYYAGLSQKAGFRAPN